MRKDQFYQILSIEPSTKEILEIVEQKTGKSFEFVEKHDLSVSASVKIARSFMANHIIAFKKGDQERISHLIAHECGHILRYYSVPVEMRVIPTAGREHHDKANYWLEKTGRKKLSRFPPSVAAKLKEIWIDGIIRQVTNLPVDYRIERWIYDSYPDLRSSQRVSLDADHSTAVAALSHNIEESTPDVIFEISHLMNCAFYSELDAQLGTSYAKSFSRFAKTKICDDLRRSLQSEDEGFKQDLEVIGRWAEMLRIKDWFAWGAFEDVPANYETTF